MYIYIYMSFFFPLNETWPNNLGHLFVESLIFLPGEDLKVLGSELQQIRQDSQELVGGSLGASKHWGLLGGGEMMNKKHVQCYRSGCL